MFDMEGTQKLPEEKSGLTDADTQGKTLEELSLEPIETDVDGKYNPFIKDPKRQFDEHKGLVDALSKERAEEKHDQEISELNERIKASMQKGGSTEKDNLDIAA